MYKYFKDKYGKRKNVRFGVRLKNVNETRNYFIEEIKYNE